MRAGVITERLQRTNARDLREVGSLCALAVQDNVNFFLFGYHKNFLRK
jgi:hypothetical protein